MGTAQSTAKPVALSTPVDNAHVPTRLVLNPADYKIQGASAYDYVLPRAEPTDGSFSAGMEVFRAKHEQTPVPSAAEAGQQSVGAVTHSASSGQKHVRAASLGDVRAASLGDGGGGGGGGNGDSQHVERAQCAPNAHPTAGKSKHSSGVVGGGREPGPESDVRLSDMRLEAIARAAPTADEMREIRERIAAAMCRSLRHGDSSLEVIKAPTEDVDILDKLDKDAGLSNERHDYSSHSLRDWNRLCPVPTSMLWHVAEQLRCVDGLECTLWHTPTRTSYFGTAALYSLTACWANVEYSVAYKQKGGLASESTSTLDASAVFVVDTGDGAQCTKYDLSRMKLCDVARAEMDKCRGGCSAPQEATVAVAKLTASIRTGGLTRDLETGCMLLADELVESVDRVLVLVRGTNAWHLQQMLEKFHSMHTRVHALSWRERTRVGFGRERYSLVASWRYMGARDTRHILH